MSRTIMIALAFVLFTAGKCGSDKYEYTAETSIEMVKTSCFGTCPAYTFNLNGDGSATFNGRQFVKMEGKHNRTFPADTTNFVFTRLMEADLFQYKNEYTDNVTDLPTTYLTFKHEGRQKKMKLYYGVPAELKAITKELEALAFTQGWSEEVVDK